MIVTRPCWKEVCVFGGEGGGAAQVAVSYEGPLVLLTCRRTDVFRLKTYPVGSNNQLPVLRHEPVCRHAEGWIIL